MIKMPEAEHKSTLLFNPLWKDLARHLTSKCEKCGQERLLSVFDAYSGNHSVHCEGCLTSAASVPIIRFLFFSFKIDPRRCKIGPIN
jgi:hypothetical protein